ncbi:hypothetical protein AVEN_218724-1 [Araneus ventricosus]|uniref:Uncharacterized protein n=1 Tax=Araneus ventricosus TaxID=182803 RepID=A0A4Y2B6Q9_ARAVE|nr:hypothetical protein AVEN_218724-1 [Araneus ventricosus]
MKESPVDALGPHSDSLVTSKLVSSSENRKLQRYEPALVFPWPCPLGFAKDNNLFGFDLCDGKPIARRIPPGCYETIPDVLNGLYLESFKNKIEMNYNPIIKRVKINTKGQAKVILYNGISELLGFEKDEFSGNVERPYIADPSAEQELR